MQVYPADANQGRLHDQQQEPADEHDAVQVEEGLGGPVDPGPVGLPRRKKKVRANPSRTAANSATANPTWKRRSADQRAGRAAAAAARLPAWVVMALICVVNPAA